MPSFRSLFHFSPRPASSVDQNEPSPRAPSPGGLWRRAPAQAWPLGHEVMAVQVIPSDRVHTFPRSAVEWALACTAWRTLDEHVDQLHAQHGSDPEVLETLLLVVPQIVNSGLLVSDKSVREWSRRTSPASDQRVPIAAIGFPTGGVQGLELVPRAIRSFSENLNLYNRNADLIVCDSSLEPALREKYRSRIQALSQELGRPVRYLGYEEKQRFANELSRLGACPPDVAEFALNDPLETGFAPGANRNMLLLDQAGEMLCSVDHDVLCRTTGAPEAGEASLSIFSECDPFVRWTFADPATADRTARWETPDFLALHESTLGRGTGEIVPAESDHKTLDFQHAKDAILQRLATGSTRIRATFCGHSGEPGVPSAVYYLAYRGANRKRLTSSEAHYRAALTSRKLLALSPSPAIGDASLSPGVAFGMDHRELLPPFFPVLHAEDFSWSALAWQCCPGMVIGLLPHAVAHKPIPGKAFLGIDDLGGLPPFVIWEWAHLLRFWTMTWSPPNGASAAERMRAFGRVLGEIAALPQSDFAAELRRAALATASHQIAFYESQLYSEGEDLPEYWTRDVEAYLMHLEQAVTREGFEIPLDLQQRSRSLSEGRAFAQDLAGRYSRLLSAWPDMVSAAREIRSI